MRNVFTCCLLVGVLASCDRKPPDGVDSKITIQAPRGKVGSFAALPVGRKACYAVSISGSGIKGSSGSSCMPAFGALAGFVESGGVLDLTVPRGTNRQIDLYLFLMSAGDNGACPGLGKFTSSYFSNIYKVASLSNVTLSKSVEVVEIDAVFPGETQNLAVQMSIPATCTAGAPPNPYGFSISATSETVTNGSISLTGHIGSAPIASVTAGGITLNIK